MKLKAPRKSLFKIIEKSTELTSEPVTQNGKTFHEHRSHLIPCYTKTTLLTLHIRTSNEPKSELFDCCDT